MGYADGTVASDAGLSATEIMMTCPAEFATCTADNTDFEPQTEDECASAATALGLELGGQGYSFAGSYSTGGCYSYFSGTYAGHAYWSTGSSGLGSSKYRVQTQCSTQIAGRRSVHQRHLRRHAGPSHRCSE